MAMVTIDRLKVDSVWPVAKAVALAKTLNDDPDDDWRYVVVPVDGKAKIAVYTPVFMVGYL